MPSQASEPWYFSLPSTLLPPRRAPVSIFEHSKDGYINEKEGDDVPNLALTRATKALMKELSKKMEDGTADIYEVFSVMRDRDREEGIAWYNPFLLHKCIVCAILRVFVSGIVAFKVTYEVFGF